MSAVFSLCACIYGKHATERSNLANSVIWLREKCAVLSVELQQIECTLMDDLNNLYVNADRGHILIFLDLLSSYCTPLLYCNAAFKSRKKTPFIPYHDITISST